ncbi:MAG TPA: RNA 2',3'-cyclic phosphodiesterase [Gammaproteobacteria bacterium]|nr:RNA 2',3'-cyclic phosphodiesterase [Gammaproteobacteria bacterium]
MPQHAHATRPSPTPARARLFFALWPDEGVRDAIHKASRGPVSLSDGRPVPRQNFHVTLAFLGGLDEAATQQAMAAADEVNLPAFRFELDTLGYWPNSQVLWFGCGTPPAGPRRLAHALRQRLTAHTLRPDPGKFALHVTLARRVHKAAALEHAQKIAWDVKQFALICSETRAGGVDYTVRARWPLGRQHALI